LKNRIDEKEEKGRKGGSFKSNSKVKNIRNQFKVLLTVKRRETSG